MKQINIPWYVTLIFFLLMATAIFFAGWKVRDQSCLKIEDIERPEVRIMQSVIDSLVWHTDSLKLTLSEYKMKQDSLLNVKPNVTPIKEIIKFYEDKDALFIINDLHNYAQEVNHNLRNNNAGN